MQVPLLHYCTWAFCKSYFSNLGHSDTDQLLSARLQGKIVTEGSLPCLPTALPSLEGRQALHGCHAEEGATGRFYHGTTMLGVLDAPVGWRSSRRKIGGGPLL